jgi:integrase
MQQACARYLGYLRDVDPPLLDLAIEESLTPPRFREFCLQLEETNSSVSVASIAGKLYMTVRYMAPDHDWNWLRVFVRRLEAKAVPRRGTAIPFTSDRLVDLGLALMEKAEIQSAFDFAAHGQPKLRTAILYRDGILLCLEALIPLRVSNLALLKLGTTIRKVADRYWILLDSEHTKNRDPIEVELPAWLSGPIDTFVGRYRPAFKRARGTTLLFPSAKHDRLTEAGLASAFKKRVLQSTGVDTSIHRARHIAATTIAIADPANVSVASDLLSHRSEKITEAHYIMANGIEASRTAAREILKLRKHQTTATDL